MSEETGDPGATEAPKLPDIPGKIDLKYEETGDWFEHADPDGIAPTRPNQIEDFYHKLVDRNGNGLRRLKVRSYHLPEVQAQYRRIERVAARKPKAQRDEYTLRAKAKVMARLCALDWDFTDRSGEAIPFSPEVSELILGADECRDHRTFLMLACSKLAGDIDATAEEDRGN